LIWEIRSWHCDAPFVCHATVSTPNGQRISRSREVSGMRISWDCLLDGVHLRL